ncbi:MAG: hypothetical protein ACI9MJ_000566 [Alphaproteobacteria bacterium]|jgi:hypothetical protein
MRANIKTFDVAKNERMTVPIFSIDVCVNDPGRRDIVGEQRWGDQMVQAIATPGIG